MIDGETCPVCGRDVIETNVIPEHLSPELPPHAPGTQFVHRREEVEPGRFEVGGCSMYENGEIHRWEPSENSSKEDN